MRLERDHEDAGREALRVIGGNYQAFLQIENGGLSSLLDRDGRDWINFQEVGDDQYPASAAGRFRGFPNMIHGEAEAGASHPGFDRAKLLSIEQTGSENDSRISVSFESYSSRWKWRFDFLPNRIELHILKVPSDGAYWVLYEGTPGGDYAPLQNYWAASDSPPTKTRPGFIEGTGVYGKRWQWFYLGDHRVQRILYFTAPDDQAVDQFAYLGDDLERGVNSAEGMTVLGFGRSDKPLMTQPASFSLGFMDGDFSSKEAYQGFAARLQERNY